MYTLFTIAVSGKKPSLTDLLLTHKSQGHQATTSVSSGDCYEVGQHANGGVQSKKKILLGVRPVRSYWYHFAIEQWKT